jgi:hypothetical protein
VGVAVVLKTTILPENKLNIDVADLEKLEFACWSHEDCEGVLDADIQSVDLDYPNGKFSFTHPPLPMKKEQFIMDSITMIATSTADKNTLFLSLPF